MKNQTYLILIILCLSFSCKNQHLETVVYESESLKIKRLSKHAFIHVSYLNTDDYGKVPCNGVVLIDKGEAMVFDTPADNATSNELIKWVEVEHNAKITGVVVTHFHADCLGGLALFHERNIPSYANNLTITLAKESQLEVPQHGFSKELELQVGDKKISNQFFGSGHTKDNIVSAIHSEKLLFGGCLIKSLGAGKGYLGDADTLEWSNTVSKIKETYSGFTVVPGHGKPGGTALLDYTIDMFDN